jgi:predicted ferric reductase
MHKRSPLAAYLVLLAVAVSIAAILLGLARTPGLYGFARGAALVGYQFVLLAVVSSAFVKPLVRTYHKPFIKLHHWVSVSGLALLMVHPILLVIATGRPALLIAAYTTDFFRYAGSPALTLLLIAAAAAVLRTRVAKVWRYVHWLTYVALILGAIHAVLAGSSAAMLPWVRWLLVAFAIAGVAVYAYKRLGRASVPARSHRQQ